MKNEKYDIFISHASEDKADIARPLAEQLQKLGLRVWLDEFELKLGDSLRRKIDNGLAKSKFGLVILSPAFFSKEWPNKELDGLVAREDGREKVVLPVWHNISAADIIQFSPMLADKFAVSTSSGLSYVVERVFEAVRHEPISNENILTQVVINETEQIELQSKKMLPSRSQEVLLHEYNNLWNEKMVLKQSIRKFNNYLLYTTVIGSLALVFYGTSSSTIFNGLFSQAISNPILMNNHSIIQMFFIVFVPVVLITFKSPLNDFYNIHVIGCQIADLEKRINGESGNTSLLTWEHAICPAVYGGEKEGSEKIMFLGDSLLLIPAISTVCIITTYISFLYLSQTFGAMFSILYVLVILYMTAVITMLALKVMRLTRANGPIAGIVSAKQKSADNIENNR